MIIRDKEMLAAISEIKKEASGLAETVAKQNEAIEGMKTALASLLEEFGIEDTNFVAEQWKPLPFAGFETYEVSSFGRIRNSKTGNVLHTNMSHGYPRFFARVNGKAMSKGVAETVCIAFCGEKPRGMEVKYHDGDRLNCYASNVYWGKEL